MYSSDCSSTYTHKIVDVGKIGVLQEGNGRQVSLYRRQGLTSRASIIFTTSQIPLSDYASFSSTIGNPGWFLQTHLNRQTVWFIQYLGPFLSLFFDPILEPFTLLSHEDRFFFFVFLLFSFRVLFSSPGRGIVFLHFFNSYRSRVKEKKNGLFATLVEGDCKVSHYKRSASRWSHTYQRTLDVLHTCHNLPRPDLSITKILR